MSTMNTPEILAAMQCPVCCDVLRPPIRLCKNGHAVCQDCHDKLDQMPQTSLAMCPICREHFQSMASGLLEIIYDRLEIRCKYGIQGCRVSGYGCEVRIHEEECTFRAKKCSRCPWKGLHSLLMDHYIEEHLHVTPPTIVIRKCPRCTWQGLQTLLTKHYIENHV